MVTRENVTINEKSFESGIVTFAPTSMAFSLDKKYSSFKTCIGIDKNVDDGGPACDNTKEKMKFQVLGDGVILKMNEKSWFTKNSEEDASCFEIEVGKVSVLELRSQYHSNLQQCGMAVWADAAVFRKGMFYYNRNNNHINGHYNSKCINNSKCLVIISTIS